MALAEPAVTLCIYLEHEMRIYWITVLYNVPCMLLFVCIRY